MKILITGGLGFVGVNLALYFKDKHEILCIDNRFKKIGSGYNLELLEKNKINFQYCDIRNQNEVENIFQKFGKFDVILHMASQVAFSISVKYPRLDFEINAIGSFNILEAVRKFSKKSFFIYASTNQVYGEMKDEKLIELKSRFDFKYLINGVPETYRTDFLSPYGCSKGVGEIYSIDYGRVYNIKTLIFRFGGIYGKNQFSYEDHGWISFITNKIRKNESFNRFGHGKQVRDVLYIDDICRAMDLAILNSKKIKSGEVINLGGGKNNALSVIELMKIVEKITGNKEKSIINKMRKADKLVMYLDIEKANNLLRWKPKISYENGIKKLIKWQNSISKKIN